MESTKPTSNEAENGNKSKPLLAVVFAQWIAEDHFRLYNIENGVYYWKNEDEIQTTEELFERFKLNDAKEIQYLGNLNHNDFFLEKL